MTSTNPSEWLNFSLPPRQRTVPGSGGPVIPRRSRRAGFMGNALSRERFVHANFRFVLKPNETLSYGAHFADPDIAVHWPHILQVLVPTFSAFSVAQGYVSSDPAHTHANDEELGRSFEEHELDEMGEEAAERRRRVEEERRGRNCPICLGRPVAGRMTKCGHIFCFPCILHYIQLSDIPKSAKCPICGDTVHEGMLKSVKYLDAATMLAAASGSDDGDEPISELSQSGDDSHHQDPMVGDLEGFEDAKAVENTAPDEQREAEPQGHRIHMRLVQRPQMTTMALPAAPTWPSEAIPPHTVPWHFLPDVLSYSRFMLATPEYMLAELEREMGELNHEWDMLRGDDLGRDFVRAAREKVERQTGKVRAELMTGLVRKQERESREAWGEAVGGERREREKRRERERRMREREEATRLQPVDLDVPTELLASQAALNPNVNIPPNLPVEPNPLPIGTPKRSRRRNHGSQPIVANTPPSPSYHFYQSSLGTQVYLHPLDIRILLAHYKSYSLFPPTISFTSSGFDPATINDELRKRCKYLSHLPAGTEVIFVEADLEEIVGKEGLAAFDQPLKARRAKRRERVKREDRAKSRWEAAEREKTPLFTASSPTPAAEDREFALAIARSTADATWSSDPILGTSQGSSSLSSSPVNGSAWGAHPQPRATFARALHSHTASSTPVRLPDDREREWEVDAAWEAFDRLNIRPSRASTAQSDAEVDIAIGTEREAEKGGGERRQGGKKGRVKGQKLVLGGGGGRRA
ncbi:hypothetical protein BCR39DRAFT_565612 [Naematelia encephala]|uniref:RING-type domain-containing protein n=1 Tax=Naematelia encephala TaxID=71784 RepID=A0A1Y2AYW7_9TREE|nr:hypothetical protein BCR39DRAFT_565612 [Naematelia encephala]